MPSVKMSLGTIRTMGYSLFGAGIMLCTTTVKEQKFFGLTMTEGWINGIGAAFFVLGCMWLGNSDEAMFNVKDKDKTGT